MMFYSFTLFYLNFKYLLKRRQITLPNDKKNPIGAKERDGLFGFENGFKFEDFPQEYFLTQFSLNRIVLQRNISFLEKLSTKYF